MTTDLEEIADGLHSLAHRNGIPPAPVDTLLARGRRARRGRAGLLATATAGTVAAAAAAIAFAGAPATSPAGPPAVAIGRSTAGEAPAMRLAAAARDTSAGSFRFTTNSRWPSEGEVQTWTGAVDPRAGVGYVRWDDGELRVIGTAAYLRGANGWQLLPRKGSVDTIYSVGGSPAKAADPGSMLKSLGAGDTAQVTKDQDTYSFRLSFDGQYTDAPGRTFTVLVTGKVKVDPRSGKVAKISSEEAWPKGPRTVVIDYSGYGEPVSVQRPALDGK